MSDKATPREVGLSEGLGPLRKAVDGVMQYQFTHSRPAMHALQVLIDEAINAADEIDRLKGVIRTSCNRSNQ